MIFNSEDKIKFENSTSCHICTKTFKRQIHHCHRDTETSCDLCIDQPDVIVRDHCHILWVSLNLYLLIYLT